MAVGVTAGGGRLCPAAVIAMQLLTKFGPATQLVKEFVFVVVVEVLGVTHFGQNILVRNSPNTWPKA